MSVVFPKLPKGYRWFVTEPRHSYGGEFYLGYVKKQRKVLGVWWTMKKTYYHPVEAGGMDSAIRYALNRLHPVKYIEDSDKYVGPH